MSTMGDDAFRAFTEGLARTIRAEERKRLWRLLIATALVIGILLAMLVLQQRQDRALRVKLADQCEARNVILDLQRDLYRTMTRIDEKPDERAAFAQILSGLPSNRNCADFLR